MRTTVICNDCGKKYHTLRDCPACGSSDVDIEQEPVYPSDRMFTDRGNEYAGQFGN